MRREPRSRSMMRAVTGIALLLSGIGCSIVESPMRSDPVINEASVEQVRDFFASQKRQVVTFAGFSGAGYEDERAMLDHAAAILDQYDPAVTIVNIGATAEGIGAVYGLAKRKGFMTTGIVSTQARAENVALSPDVDRVFFVADSSWGGKLPDSDRLSPTSTAMVENSDVFVAIGGGDVARDEMAAAERAGKTVRFIPADMDHRAALEKAKKKGQPPPTTFGGSAAEAFEKR